VQLDRAPEYGRFQERPLVVFHSSFGSGPNR